MNDQPLSEESQPVPKELASDNRKLKNDAVNMLEYVIEQFQPEDE